MITLRVAYNFWNTGLPYYNINEAVSANTSLVWPMVLAGLFAVFDLRQATGGMILLSAGMFAALCAVTALAAGRLKALVFGVLILSPTAYNFAATGWDLIPETLFVTLAFLALLKASDQAGRCVVPTASMILLACSFLLRPDAAFIVATIGVYWVYQQRTVPSAWPKIAGLICVPVLYLSLMWVFYRDFVPNTAYLKVEISPIMVLRGLVNFPNVGASGTAPWWMAVLCLLWAFLRPPEKLILAAALVHSAYLVLAGGDSLPGGRLFMPILPILVLLVLRVIDRHMDLSGRVMQAALLAAILSLSHSPSIWTIVMHDRNPFYQPSDFPMKERVRIAQMIRARLDPADGAIGLHSLGIGYHMPEFTIADFHSKADPYIARLEPMHTLHIGHNKHDYDHSFSRYNIAAFPVPAGVVEFVKRRGPGDWRTDYWHYRAQSVSKAMALGTYRLVPPQDLGLTGEMGLFIRADLYEKFTSSQARR